MKRLLSIVVATILTSCGVKSSNEEVKKNDTIFSGTISGVKISNVKGIDSIIVEDIDDKKIKK